MLTRSFSILQLDKKFAAIESAAKNKEITSHLKSDVTELWVQKYKPSSYLDLLSDEVS